MSTTTPFDLAGAEPGQDGSRLMRCARTPREVEDLRTIWKSLSVADVDADIDYFLTVTRTGDGIISPYVFHVRSDDGRHLLAVARLQEQPIALRFGYRTLATIRLRALVVAFDGILGARGRADEDLVVAELKRALDRGEADILIMRNVAADGSLLAAFDEALPWLRRNHARSYSMRWLTDLPASLDELLKRRSAKSRGTLRRHERHLIEHYGARMTLRRYDQPGEIDTLTDVMEAVSRRSYQHGLGVAYTGTPLQRGLIALGLEKGWHRTWVLSIDDRPVAFWTGVGYGGTFFIGTPGFDPDYAKESVGRSTMLRMFEDLCADPAISRLDYGQGEAEYKAAFGHPGGLECEVMLASRRPIAMATLAAVSALGAINIAAKRIIEETSFGRRLKARWKHGR